MHSTDGIRAAVDTVGREVALLGERAPTGNGKDLDALRASWVALVDALALGPGARVPEVPALRRHRDARRDPLQHLLGEARSAPGARRTVTGARPDMSGWARTTDGWAMNLDGSDGAQVFSLPRLELRSSSKGWRSLCFLADGSQREVAGGIGRLADGGEGLGGRPGARPAGLANLPGMPQPR